jgi:hypothetical protein
VQTISLGTSLSIAAAGFPGSMAGGADTDGSESITVSLTLNNALPAGATLSSTAGVVVAGVGTSYTVTASNGHTLSEAVAGLQVTVPASWNGAISGTLGSVAVDTVSAGSVETDLINNSWSDEDGFSVTVTPVDLNIKISGSGEAAKAFLTGESRTVTVSAVFADNNPDDNRVTLAIPDGFSVDLSSLPSDVTYSNGILTFSHFGETLTASFKITNLSAGDASYTFISEAIASGDVVSSLASAAVYAQRIIVANNDYAGTEPTTVEGYLLANDISRTDSSLAVKSLNGVEITGGSLEIAGIYGTITVDAHGHYVYVATSSSGSVSRGVEEFSYVAADAEGNLSTASLVVSTSQYLKGTNAADTLVAGSDGAILQGGGGSDTLVGSSASDVFVWHLADAGKPWSSSPTVDVVKHFGDGNDFLQLNDLISASSTVAVNAGINTTIVVSDATHLQTIVLEDFSTTTLQAEELRTALLNNSHSYTTG